MQASENEHCQLVFDALRRPHPCSVVCIYIRLLCFAVTEQLDMNIKSKKNIKHIYNNTMQCNIIRGLHVVI